LYLWTQGLPIVPLHPEVSNLPHSLPALVIYSSAQVASLWNIWQWPVVAVVAVCTWAVVVVQADYCQDQVLHY
jgi:hypothetical protein